MFNVLLLEGSSLPRTCFGWCELGRQLICIPGMPGVVDALSHYCSERVLEGDP